MGNRANVFVWLGILSMIAIGLVHGIDAPDSFSETFYKGVLFYANTLGCLTVAIGVFKKFSWSWNLGLVIAVGSILAYIASRTVGLPGIPAEPDAWFEPLGITAMSAEILFVAVYVLHKKEK